VINPKKHLTLILSWLFFLTTSLYAQNTDKADLLGTWQLIKYIDHASLEDEWSTYDNHILYQKHITESHFTWVQYDQKKDQLLGMGGGT
jgi:hypothetical protein